MYEIFEKLLKEHGVSAYKVAKDTGIANSTFSDWKKGVSTPKADKMLKIANYFGVTTDYLLGNTTDPAIPEDDEVSEYIDVLHKRGEMRMLFSVARNATKEDIEKAVKIIEALKDN